MFEAIVVVRPGDWAERIVKDRPVLVKMSDSHVTSEATVRDLVEIAAPDDRVDEAVALLKADPSVIEADVHVVDRSRAVGVVTSRSPVRARVAEVAGFIDAARSNRDGTLEYSIYVREPAEVKRLVKSLKKEGVQCDLRRVTALDEAALLPSTERILQAAYKRGFFDHPRRVGLRELAKVLNLDPANLGEILREGRKKIIGSYLRGAKLRI
ncbi:MAG TPA: helix-turn-helix domain-containing protein [Thermoplasmata archaeon]|nr:helix-turn-helix domain-containing protein [Thermoplasmata archaeon]